MSKDKNIDPFKNMFRQIPEETIPAHFRANVMHQILTESIRIKKRNERLGLAAVIAASLVIVALGILALLYLDIPQISIQMPSLTFVPFYVYIGILSMLLLWVDHIFRKKYKEKHTRDER